MENLINWISERKSALLRTVLLIVALINQALTASGHSVLPFDDEQITEILTYAFTVLTSVYAWWKNNSFSESAVAADTVMTELKSSVSEEDEDDLTDTDEDDDEEDETESTDTTSESTTEEVE